MAKLTRRRQRHRFAPYVKSAIAGAGRVYRLYKNAKRLRVAVAGKRTISRSRTKTRTRRRGRRSYGDNGDDAASSSFIHKGRGRRKAMFRGYKKFLGMRTVNTSMNTKVTIAGGSQAVVCTRLVTNGSSHANTIGSAYDLGLMRDNLRFDEYDPGLNPDAYKTMKFYVSKIKTLTYIRNSTTAPVHIQLYNCVARKDTPSDDPTTAWANGLLHAEAPALGTGDILSTRPGATPFQSMEFTKMYKVKKVREFTLHAGSTHKHYMTLYPNKLWSAGELETDTVYGGISTYLMIVAKGDVAHQVLNVNDIVYSYGALDIITDYRATGYMLEKNRSVGTWYQSNPYTSGVLEQVVEDTDVVAPVDT